MKGSFFYIHEDDSLSIAVKLVEKLYENNQNTLILTSSEMESDILDDKLWTFSKISFVPHVTEKRYSDNLIVHSVISDTISVINDSRVLLHCNIDLCEDRYSSYKNIIADFDKIYHVMTKKFLDRCIGIANMLCEIGFENKYYVYNNTKWESLDKLVGLL